MPRQRDEDFTPRDNILTIIEAFARGDTPNPRRLGSDKVYVSRSNGRIYAHNNSRQTCSTDGNIIYSYNEPIAIKLHDANNTVVVRERWRTNTTSHQIRACKICLPQYGFRVQVVPDPKEAVQAVEHRKRHRYDAVRPHGRCALRGAC